MNYFYNNIRYLRKKNNWSLQQMADKIKVNPSTISRWEKEEIGVNMDNVYDIAERLCIPINTLIGEDMSNPSSIESELDRVLFSKAKDLSEDDKKAVIGIINALKKEVDKELDK